MVAAQTAELSIFRGRAIDVAQRRHITQRWHTGQFSASGIFAHSTTASSSLPARPGSRSRRDPRHTPMTGPATPGNHQRRPDRDQLQRKLPRTPEPIRAPPMSARAPLSYPSRYPLPEYVVLVLRVTG